MPMPKDAAKLTRRVDISFLNVRFMASKLLTITNTSKSTAGAGILIIITAIPRRFPALRAWMPKMIIIIIII